MTAEEKLKKHILQQTEFKSRIRKHNIDELYSELVSTNSHWDSLYELRSGEIETGLSSTSYSRNYESKEVAAKMSDGSWVGWTYWYGGGKHGCPDEIEWMSKAYHLKLTEEKKVVVVQNWEKV